MSDDARETLGQLVEAIQRHFGARLIGLYLFGSLTTGDFVAGRSDLDVIAVLDPAVSDGDDLDGLRRLHEQFAAEHPDWRNRIEVLYLSRTILATFDGDPSGTVARISPGEPLHLRELEGNRGWRLDWFGVLNGGETLRGPAPLAVGPAITAAAFREAVAAHLAELREAAREDQVAYVPALQGYLAATISRAVYSLETGRPISKTAAIEWAAERYPAYAGYLRSAFAAYRADVRIPHQRLIDFVDSVSTHPQPNRSPLPSSGRDGS